MAQGHQIDFDRRGRCAGVDTKGELYWHGKPVEIRRPLDLTWRQKLVAGIVATATVIAAIGGGSGLGRLQRLGLQGRLEIGGVSATVTNKPIRRPC